jgi:hypothetical protein
VVRSGTVGEKREVELRYGGSRCVTAMVARATGLRPGPVDQGLEAACDPPLWVGGEIEAWRGAEGSAGGAWGGIWGGSYVITVPSSPASKSPLSSSRTHHSVSQPHNFCHVHGLPIALFA